MKATLRFTQLKKFSLNFSSSSFVIRVNRELKQPRRRVKNEFICYQRNSRFSRSVWYAYGSKISRGRPRGVDDAEVGRFTLLTVLQGTAKNVQRFITHVHSYCFAH